MEILIVGIIIWLALPVPLFIMWIIAHGREMRQREYLKELYLQHRILPEELIRRVHGAVDRFADHAPQFDDITMLCLKYRGTTEEGQA